MPQVLAGSVATTSQKLRIFPNRNGVVFSKYKMMFSLYQQNTTIETKNEGVEKKKKIDHTAVPGGFKRDGRQVPLHTDAQGGG